MAVNPFGQKQFKCLRLIDHELTVFVFTKITSAGSSLAQLRYCLSEVKDSNQSVEYTKNKRIH